MEDAEKIRLKRLEKLSEQQVPRRSAAVPQSNVEAPKRKVSSSLQSPQKVQFTPEEIENSIIEDVLQVTITKGKSGLLRLSELEIELKNEGISLLDQNIIERCLVARISLEQNSHPNLGYRSYISDCSVATTLEKSLFDYLCNCWKRNMETSRLTKKDEFLPVFIKIEQLLVSYIRLVLQFPDMFPQPHDVIESGSCVIVPALIANSDSSTSIPLELVEKLVLTSVEEGLNEIFSPIIRNLCAEIRKSKITSNYIPIVRAFGFLLQFKPIAIMVAKLPSWNPANLTARSFEIGTILGPFFRLTTFGTDDPEFSTLNFGENFQRTRSNVDSIYVSSRLSLENLQSSLHSIVMSIIRASTESKEAILEWFATGLRLNGDRGKMHIADPLTVGSEGFMTNVFAVLLRLCDPIMDTGYTKLHLIDPNYLTKSSRIDVTKLTKFNATPEEEQAYYSRSDTDMGVNFVTEIFFLTASYFHYGLHRTLLSYVEMQKELREIMNNFEQMKRDKEKWLRSPRGPMYEQLLKRVETRKEQLIGHKLSFDIVLTDEKFLSHSLQFLQLLMRFLLRVSTSPAADVALNDPEYGKGLQFQLQHGNQRIKLPLKSAAPECFRMYPEYFAEDVSEFILHLARFFPPALAPNGSNAAIYEIMGFAVTFLRCRSGITLVATEDKDIFVKNPYLISKLVEVIFTFTWDFGQGNYVEQATKNIFGVHPIAHEHLVSGLIGFYVDAEKTGLSSQFYDKFGIRYNISQILKLLWKTYPAIYRNKVFQESVNRWDVFVKFVNLLMNDTTYLLDESMTKLRDIHGIQLEMSSPEWNAKDENAHAETEKRLADLERSVQSYLQLGNETVHMLQYLTTSIVDPFLRPEIIDRLAAMLNFNLAILVGPRCTELKVQNPEKYHFNPKNLMAEITDIYLHLSENLKREDFIAAVARDGRSYSRAYFERAASILLNKAVRSQEHVNDLLKFAEMTEQIVKQDIKEEADLGDVPDEFMDPLMFTIMDEPVLLPNSKVIVDKSTITSHLLSDSTDPFNRSPLTLDMVVPATELKQKIIDWKNSKIGKK